MTINDIWQQAQGLTPQDRKELAKRLIDSLDVGIEDRSASAPAGHWGENLIRLLEELGPIELAYPEIEDPVAWVQQIREDQRAHRMRNMGSDE